MQAKLKLLLTLQEQGQERNEEHQEDGLNAASDPVKNGNQVVATGLAWLYIAGRIDLANRELLVQSTNVHHYGNNWLVFITTDSGVDIRVNMKTWME